MSGQSGCNEGLFAPPRVIDHDQLQADYQLEVGKLFKLILNIKGQHMLSICYANPDIRIF